MKVYVIHPKAPPTIESLSEGLSWWGADANLAPLDLALITALTPDGVELKVADQQAGDAVNFEETADAVVFVAAPEHIPGLRYLSGRFRARRIPVVIAGRFVSQWPERADMADVKLIGDLEEVWPAFLNDRQSGAPPRREYRAQAPFDLYRSPLPRWDALPLSRYRLAPIEVARQSADGTVRYKPMAKVVEELELLAAHGVRRVRLQAPDLLADRDLARGLLEALAESNGRRQRKVRFEARVSVDRAQEVGLVELMGRANVRRVELDLNAPELASQLHHEDPREAIDAVRRLHAQGIRVAGRLTVFRDGDDDQSWGAQTAVAREANAIPWPRAARVVPGSALYDRLREAGRLVQGGRDADLRVELFEPPHFTPERGTRELQGEQLRSLVLELFTAAAVDHRLGAFLREATQAPLGDMWPAREDLRAVARMVSGTFQNRGEERVRMTARALATVLTSRPPLAVWSQAIDQLLEEAATRSFVLKSADGRPLEAAAPAMSWKQRAVGLGAKLVSVAASRKM